MMMSNNSSGQEDDYDATLTFGLLIYLILMISALLFAVASNGLVIYCVARFKKLRTVTNVFVCNLSVSDIFLAGFIMPPKLHDITHYMDYHEGEILCKAVNFCPIIAITSSVYTLVFVSFERRQAITQSRFQGRRLTPCKLACTIIFIWTLAIGISCPTLLEYTIHEKEVTEGNHSKKVFSCESQISRELSLANAILVLIVSYVIPVILLTNNYSHLAKFVWRKGRWLKENSEYKRCNFSCVRMFKQRTKIVRLFVLVAAVFALSWLPYFVILLYAKATGRDASENAAGFINLALLALATLSTAYNVILYVIFNPSFKKAILGILKCTNTGEVERDVGIEQSQNAPPSPLNRDGVVNTTIPNTSSTISGNMSRPDVNTLNTGDINFTTDYL